MRSSIAKLDNAKGSRQNMSIRIIGLGNTILRDDGVGIYAVREVSRLLAESGRSAMADVVESEVGGFELMELMAGWEQVILADSVQFDALEAGAVIRIEPEDLHTSLRLRSVHEIDLPTVLELGRRLGLAMPRKITIFGIQAKDPLTFGESMTAVVQDGMRKLVVQILNEIMPTGI